MQKSGISCEQGSADAQSVDLRMRNIQLLDGGKSCVPIIPLNHA